MGMYSATLWDYAIFLGSIGLFFACFFSYSVLPMISIFEMRELVTIPEEPMTSGVKSQPLAIYGLMASSISRKFCSKPRAVPCGRVPADGRLQSVSVDGLAEAIGFHKPGFR
jgi:hypothetical protein